MKRAPWDSPDWLEDAERRSTEALESVGRPPTGEWTTVKKWARSWVCTVPTAAGTVWVKHSYSLPPGEEVVVGELFPRYSDAMPTIVATWPGGFAMESLPGEELTADHPREAWLRGAATLARFAAGERAHVDAWLERGVRDRRPPLWRGAVEALLESPVLDSLEGEIRRGLDRLAPDFIDRYVQAFRSPATLIHQDSGCCNMHLFGDAFLLFDWADVVVGHPLFSCDRYLDQAPRAFHPEIIETFCAGAEIPIEEFRAVRRSNVLHEVLRYHDELAYIDPASPPARSLAKSVCSQIGVLIAHELKRGSSAES